MKSLSIAATGMLAQQLNVEVISNNIANMNTTAYKRQRAEFQDLIYQNLRRVGSTSSDAGTVVPTGIQIGVGVKAGSVYRISGQGNLTPTDNTYDLAIQGEGYFRISLPTGEDAYTRAGSFQLNASGQIVTTDGYELSPAITVPQDTRDVSINSQGQVEAFLDGQTDPTILGQLEIVRFFNQAGLEAKGSSLFLETAASGAPVAGTPGSVGYGTLLQGYLETSNVDSVGEITNLISAQRAYEMNAKVITSTDEMLSVASNLR
ncbi:flagellar basal-body rod protein FlgG [Pyruvatibacter sp.]|uniref:flagellar basal-body rod protein FlgG n=1 Tax=Pyruvatibacter sp. TaxID=1981328 RepID=UPI0032EEE361